MTPPLSILRQLTAPERQMYARLGGTIPRGIPPAVGEWRVPDTAIDGAKDRQRGQHRACAARKAERNRLRRMKRAWRRKAA